MVKDKVYQVTISDLQDFSDFDMFLFAESSVEARKKARDYLRDRILPGEKMSNFPIDSARPVKKPEPGEKFYKSRLANYEKALERAKENRERGY